ncbi:MAG: phage major capsid protein [Oscillospiraceae bacterium]
MLKALIEKRNATIEAMKALVATAETENRAFTEEEGRSYEDYKKEIASLDKTIAAAEEARELSEKEIKNDGDGEETNEAKEERAFKEFIVAAVEQRAADVALTKGANGSVIPASIVNKIITKTKEICPIFAKSTLFVAKGKIKVPVYGADDEHDIAVGYQEEFQEITADAGKFTTIELDGYLVGALALISKTLIDNTDIDIVKFVIEEMARKIATFIERELLIGTDGKCSGALSTTNTISAAKANAITADELIDLQVRIPTAYQTDACWTMHPKTFAYVKKLKDGNGQYLLQPGLSEECPYVIFGKPVYPSDNMPEMEAGKPAVLYGDYSGIGTKLGNTIEFTPLVERFATMNAIGILTYFELDSKVIDAQKLATITMAASS